METPSAFDYSIHFSVPTRQRSTFDREMADLPPAFLGFPTTGEDFDDPAACKARLQGFSLEQEFAVIVDKSNKDAFSGAVEKVWILTVISLTHIHSLRNPFGYKIYVKAIIEYKVLTIKMRHMRC